MSFGCLRYIESTSEKEAKEQQAQPSLTRHACRRARQDSIETLISEEALLFAKYLRNERELWKPRIAAL